MQEKQSAAPARTQPQDGNKNALVATHGLGLRAYNTEVRRTIWLYVELGSERAGPEYQATAPR